MLLSTYYFGYRHDTCSLAMESWSTILLNSCSYYYDLHRLLQISTCCSGQIIVVDHGSPQLSGTTTVYVHVLDSNIKPPKFEQASYVFYTRDSMLTVHYFIDILH